MTAARSHGFTYETYDISFCSVAFSDSNYLLIYRRDICSLVCGCAHNIVRIFLCLKNCPETKKNLG